MVAFWIGRVSKWDIQVYPSPCLSLSVNYRLVFLSEQKAAKVKMMSVWVRVCVCGGDLSCYTHLSLKVSSKTFLVVNCLFLCTAISGVT